MTVATSFIVLRASWRLVKSGCSSGVFLSKSYGRGEVGVEGRGGRGAEREEEEVKSV
jgi:hypothetical protein